MIPNSCSNLLYVGHFITGFLPQYWNEPKDRRCLQYKGIRVTGPCLEQLASGKRVGAQNSKRKNKDIQKCFRNNAITRQTQIK